MNNTKINLGVIGSGAIVERFLLATQNIDSINLYAFYSRSEEKALQFKSRYNFEKSYTNLEEMSKDKDLDAVYIASPNALHHDHAILFLENNKHVLCEKAFASNSLEVKNMIDTANKNNVILMEAMRLTALPNFIQVKHNLHKIGKIRKYFASYCQYSSRYDKYKEGIVLNAFKNELSNGALMDIGVYCLAPMINLFGEPNDLAANCNMLDTGVDSQGSVIFKYDDMDGVIMYSKISNSSIPSEIIGEKGSIVIDKINTFSNVKIVYNNGDIEDISISQYENDMYYEILEFINLVNNNKDDDSRLNPLDVSMHTMKTIDKIRKDIGVVFPADKIDNI